MGDFCLQPTQSNDDQINFTRNPFKKIGKIHGMKALKTLYTRHWKQGGELYDFSVFLPGVIFHSVTQEDKLRWCWEYA
jgi:hypothetical protein